MGTATLRTIPLPAARLGGRALTWRTPTSVVVPGVEVALEVNVDTGAVTELPGLTGYDVMTTVGVPAAALTELLTASIGADRPRIRVWGESARPQYPDRSRPGLANTTAAEPQFQDRADRRAVLVGRLDRPGVEQRHRRRPRVHLRAASRCRRWSVAPGRWLERSA